MTGNVPSISQLIQLLGQFVSNQGAGVPQAVAQQVATAPPNAPSVAPPSVQQALAARLYQPQAGGQPQPGNQFVEPPPAQAQRIQSSLPQVKEYQDPSGYTLTGGHADPSAPSGWAFDKGYWPQGSTPTGSDPAPGTATTLSQQPATGGGLKQPAWQQTPQATPALGGTVTGGGQPITAPAPGTGQVIGQQFPGSRTMATAQKPSGLLQPGNIDLYNRPQVKNADGSTSTVRSISVDINGKSYLIPTVAADGSGILTNDQAVQQFRQTGQHLGIFDNHQDADAYAQQLHQQQDALYRPNLQGGPP